MTDDGPATPEAQAPQAVESIYIMEPALPAHLENSAPTHYPDRSAKVLEALAQQLTESNDFYRPLLDAAQELRDLRGVQTCLIDLLRTYNPYTKSFSR